jgi:hypothetical protein
MIPSITIVVVEGTLEVPAAYRMLGALNIPLEGITVINTSGCDKFWQVAPKYNQAAAVMGPILGLTDLDLHPCPIELITRHLGNKRHPNFLLRIAVKELESWLLADVAALADYFGISTAVFPTDPDTEPDPKQTLVNLARRSKRKSIREDIVPKQGSKGVVGKGYTPRMTEFIENNWDPINAEQISDSLRRALGAIKSATA